MLCLSRPNETALTSLTIDEIYKGSKDQTTTNQTYKNIETGLTKPEEWGAAAYLSNSKYGINKEITI